MYRLALTCGDINGIGTELAIKTINKLYNPSKRNFVLFCPQNVFEKTIKNYKVVFDYEIIKEISSAKNFSKVIVVDIGKYKQSVGTPSTYSGKASFQSIIDAYKCIQLKYTDAIITSPISKTSFQLAGIKYPGHTELFADLTKTNKFMMTFLSKDFIAGLVTIHVPIKDVSKLLNKRIIENSINTLHRMLINDLGIENPKIAVLGLNPHAGEEGKIGNEEETILKPVIKKLKNLNVAGPFVPDAFFGNKKYKKFDAVLGMYHDQVLIPFKLLNFDKGVNFTAGLPIIRTSPDHGTGFDIAGKGIADPSSFIEAVKWAEKIIAHRRRV